jgi:hypothetical protein
MSMNITEFNNRKLEYQVSCHVTFGSWQSGSRRFEGTVFLRNVSYHSPNDTATYLRRPESSEILV